MSKRNKIILISSVAVVVIAAGIFVYYKYLKAPDNIFTFQGVQMTIPSQYDWKVDHQTSTAVYIRTESNPYKVYLVMSGVHVNDSNDVQWMKNLNANSCSSEQLGIDNCTKVDDGFVFTLPCGGAIACTGGILNGDVYTFDWNVESTQPVPSDLDGIWTPDHKFTERDVMALVKTIKIAK